MTASPTSDGHTPANAGARTEDGYHRGLGKRQIQMISLGGAIGTGLFLQRVVS
ncbi:L-asparagine permease [Acetobacter pasteurianus]|uniref:L-asparagine permease n=1 Tax=Acetobacter pasteurianus TaxID=438 RepID=A0A1A0DAM3_ACEPA|nr:hypothetical protein [Acetobacter pasteurianus]OAZ72333.1 L-asparagine permease [Acetobacter pasteurianus]